MSESLARLVVSAVLVEGRTKAAVARDYGVSRHWVHELCHRYQAEGQAGLIPRSRRPRTNARRVPIEIEDAIVALRKELDDQGLSSVRTSFSAAPRPTPQEALQAWLLKESADVRLGRRP